LWRRPRPKLGCGAKERKKQRIIIRKKLSYYRGFPITPDHILKPSFTVVF
jgi:hypothetical protein